MTVRGKLGVAIALPVLLLGAMLAWHIQTTRDAVTTAHELTAVWSRVHRAAIEQTQRVAQLEETIAKYRITRDRGYLTKLTDLAAAFERDLGLLERLPLAGRPEAEVATLAEVWRRFVPIAEELASPGGRPGAGRAADLDHRITVAVDTLRFQTMQVSQASLAAMVSRLAGAEQAARDAEQASVVAGGVVLLLSTGVLLLAFRSITRPIRRLAEGAVQIGEGRFEYRIDDRQNDEFARVAADFNRMAERLGEVDRLKRDFVSTVSHDLKTPLASMQETTDLLLEEVPGPLTDTQRRLLRLHRESGQRLGRMLGQLLDLSRLDARPAPDRRPVPVADLVHSAVALAGGGAGSRRRVEARLPAEPVTVTCDPDRCRQLLDNLLDNALKFSPDHTGVQVAAEVHLSPPHDVPAGQWARVRRWEGAEPVLMLSVADEGPGIPEAERSRIFSRFYQSRQVEGRHRRGVGLGLAICREIVEAHGGAIWVTDRPGGGSIFRILLPGARRTELRHARAAAPAAAVVTT